MSGGRVGFGVAAALGPALVGEIAAEVERVGYASLWTNDVRSAPGLPLVATAQRATRSIPAGVGVIACDARTTGEIRASIERERVDLARAIVGLGSGRSPHPVSAVRRAVAELREALPGARIAVAALGPRVCRLAGEIADVALLNWMTPDRIRWARRRVEEGERRAGRARGSVVVASYVRVAVGEGARERLASEAGRYARVPSYVASFAAQRVDPAEIGIERADASEVEHALAPYRDVLDETVVRALPSADGPEAILAVARAAAP